MGDPQLDLTTQHVRLAAQGDADSLGWMFERFSPLLRAQASYRLGPVMGRQLDPEDLVAEAWLIALPKLGDLNPRDGRYTPVVLRFLASVVQNVANNRMRRFFRDSGHARPEVGDDSRPQDELAASMTGVISRASRKELALAVSAAIDELPEDERIVVVLRGIEGRSSAELAEQLGELPNTLSHRYHRALERLRNALPQSVFDEFVEA